MSQDARWVDEVIENWQEDHVPEGCQQFGLDHLFKPGVVAEIRNREPGRQQEAFIARVLMDLVDQSTAA